jgi:hypothetical protein|tara:strand:- start:179 stop:805 length:627 start_codon:yes stop_codon:yes gene_type:complete
MKPSIGIFGSKNFNKSLKEVKDFLEFNPIYLDLILESSNSLKVKGFLIDSSVCEDNKTLKMINLIKNKPVLYIKNTEKDYNCTFNSKIIGPSTVLDINEKITYLLSSLKFSENSSIKIKDYILDKNEKKLKKNFNFVVLTEREIDLLELLFKEKKSLSKNTILEKVWKYAADADTHTVETHVYRLRKKIKSKFSDENFILNNKDGYLL